MILSNTTRLWKIAFERIYVCSECMFRFILYTVGILITNKHLSINRYVRCSTSNHWSDCMKREGDFHFLVLYGRQWYQVRRVLALESAQGSEQSSNRRWLLERCLISILFSWRGFGSDLCTLFLSSWRRNQFFAWPTLGGMIGGKFLADHRFGRWRIERGAELSLASFCRELTVPVGELQKMVCRTCRLAGIVDRKEAQMLSWMSVLVLTFFLTRVLLLIRGTVVRKTGAEVIAVKAVEV